MKYDTDKHEMIGNIGKRGNQFRTTLEKNMNTYLNKLTNFDEPFTTII